MPLSARRVTTAPPGRHTDSRGLMLWVKPSGARSWVLRYQRDGRRRDMGLGPFPEVTLAEAREKALEARRRIFRGEDPLAERARARVAGLTFRAAAEALIASKRPGWRNAKHADQWGATLAAYVHPHVGGLDVRAVDTRLVVEVLQKIWTAKPETASRVRQRIEAVLNYAAAMGARTGDNPARWRGHLDKLLPKPSRLRAVRHHPALDRREAPAFMAELLARPGVAARALAFAILTAARSGEVRGMRWGEVDVEDAVWTVPAMRMKANREHRVPLAVGALVLLGKPGGPEALVFPSPTRPDTPLSDMTLTAVLKRMGRGDLTAHGFRSTFRDWTREATEHAGEVAEAALAHRLKDKVEAAYARGDLFEKRRRLMEDWAQYLADEGGHTRCSRSTTTFQFSVSA